MSAWQLLMLDVFLTALSWQAAMGLYTVLTGSTMGIMFMCSVNALRRVRLMQSEPVLWRVWSC
jgi:hypothetical protein